MIIIKTDEEVEIMRKSALEVGNILSLVAKKIYIGMSTMEIENIIQKWFDERPNYKPSFKGYNGFPFCACISVNDAVVHGFPSDKTILKEGDILSVDVGVFKNGFHGDSAYSFCLKNVNDDVKNLARITKESLQLAIKKSVVGNRIGDIAFAVEDHCFKKFGLGVVNELTGHGVGRNLHEAPSVPNYGRKGTGAKLKENCIIAIEPMINMGKKSIFIDDDNWTVRTKDGLPSAHYEHVVCIKKGKADVLSSFDKIEEEIRRNSNLVFV